MQTFFLPPFSETVVPATADVSVPPNSDGIPELDPLLLPKYAICGAMELVHVSLDRTVPVRLLNSTPNQVQVYQYSTLGTFHAADDSLEVYDLEDIDDGGTVPKHHISSLQEAKTAEHRIAPDLSKTVLSSGQQTRLIALLNQYRDVFAFSQAELGRTSIVQHHIDTDNNVPVRQRPCQTPQVQREQIDKHIKEMLEQDIIEKSTSPWASPIVLVEKKDGTSRFCVDYRKVNTLTIRDSHPLPRIDEVLDALSGTRYFTTLDLMNGYWQIQMDEASRNRTAFISYSGLYQFKVTPFGL